MYLLDNISYSVYKIDACNTDGGMVMECKEISVRALKQKLFSEKEMQILDVREPDEYRSGHIEGSVPIPLRLLPYRTEEVNRNREVIVVCRSGNRSKEACHILMERGFSNVKSLHGGLSSWTA